MQKEFEKIFFGFEMIVFELVALNTRFYWENKQYLESWDCLLTYSHPMTSILSQ